MEPRWLVSYTPGPWIVFAGPQSVVALDPGPTPDGGLINGLWSRVTAGVAMRELVGHLAGIEYVRLPRLAVVFFDSAATGEGLRALLRGPVRVLTDTGQTIAHGEDVLTWQEVRLTALERIEVDLGGGPGESLPLLHGGVRAGRLRLMSLGPAGPPAQPPPAVPVTLPPDAPEPFPPPPATPFPGTYPAPQAVLDDTLPPAPAPPPPPAPVSAPVAAPGSAPEPRSPAVEETEDADTNLMFLPPTVLGRLRAPDGSSVDLDRPVLIGRAPSNAGFENAQPHLLTVPSPSQDISRTHVLVAPEGDQIVVTDLHSTNGTIVIRPGGGPETVPAGEAVAVEVGTVIELGDDVRIVVDQGQ